jgi:hypothetical protein
MTYGKQAELNTMSYDVEFDIDLVKEYTANVMMMNSLPKQMIR